MATATIIFSILIIVLLFVLKYYSKKNGISSELPATSRELLSKNVNYYQKLEDVEKKRFEQEILKFLSNVHIEGVGVEVNEMDRIFVAASAVIPIFGFGGWKYKNLTNVILYPETFNEQFHYEGDNNRDIAGMVGTGYMNGQMILSQRALREGFINTTGKTNTGIHEFVHLLDKSDGAIDGIPENMLEHKNTIPWIQFMHEEIKKIIEGKSDINPYGATNQGEFFAVASEYFFERPDLFKLRHPELFGLMEKIFQQEPQ